MPRGAPKKTYALRLDPGLVAEVRTLTGNLTAAVEAALQMWIEARWSVVPMEDKQ